VSDEIHSVFHAVQENTRVAIAYNIGIVCFLLISPSAKQKLEDENISLKWNTFLSLSPHIMLQEWSKLYRKFPPQKSILQIVETFKLY
jgi:hypothetical protein